MWNPVNSGKWIIVTLGLLCEGDFSIIEAKGGKPCCLEPKPPVLSPSITSSRGSKGRGRGRAREEPSDWTKVQGSWRLTFLSLALTQHQHFLLPLHLRGGECGARGEAGGRGGENADICPGVRCVWVYVLQMRGKLITFLWLWKCLWPLLNKTSFTGGHLWLHLFVTFKLTICATPTARFTGSPTPLRTSLLVWF